MVLNQRGYDSESSGVTASSTTSTAVLADPVQVQIAKLSSVSTVVHCVTLSALLSAVPAKLVANHVAWLEAQPAIKRFVTLLLVIHHCAIRFICAVSPLNSEKLHR